MDLNQEGYTSDGENLSQEEPKIKIFSVEDLRRINQDVMRAEAAEIPRIMDYYYQNLPSFEAICHLATFLKQHADNNANELTSAEVEEINRQYYTLFNSYTYKFFFEIIPTYFGYSE